MVKYAYFLFGSVRVLGKLLWFGESGQNSVSKQIPLNGNSCFLNFKCWAVYKVIAGKSENISIFIFSSLFFNVAIYLSGLLLTKYVKSKPFCFFKLYNWLIL